MESTSSTFIRKIWTGEDLSLTRVQLAELKKFLAIMTYRSEHRRSEYYEDRFNQKTRKSIYNHMRHKNLTSIQEVWFDNLKWLIKTPTEEIMEEYQKVMLTREYKGPIHITELLDFGSAYRNYMCIWQAEEGSEFIMSEGCFGSWEETVYKKGFPPSTPDVDFFSPEDVFKYRRIIIPKDDVYFVNSIFLDARRKCLTYSSSASMYKTLRYYDMMKTIRPDLFKNGHDYSVLRRKLLASMNRTHTWDPPVSVFSR
ncbi:hypothetical protein BG003_006570 [Podila horticola]|nr:hypothetical protein BG003_006570 [Podila horticola]